MIFERPELLSLAPLAALLFAFTVGAHWRRLRRLAAAYDVPALRRLLPADLGRFPTHRFLSLVGAGVLIGLAAAGPVLWEPEPPEAPPPLDVALAVDLSLSMNAADGAGRRIERAREAVDLLARELPSVRFSLVVFAAWPYTLVPPTDDPDVIRYFVDSLEPEVVQETDRGNSLSAAIELAGRTLESRPSEDGRQAILVISDGDVFEDEGPLVGAATASVARGQDVWVAGVGSEDGAAISVAGETVMDVTGSAVRTSQNVALLRAVAEAGGGRYRDVSGDAGLESLVEELQVLSGDNEEGPAEPFDTTALFALLAIPLLMWEGVAESRKGGRLATPKEPGPSDDARDRGAAA